MLINFVVQCNAQKIQFCICFNLYKTLLSLSGLIPLIVISPPLSNWSNPLSAPGGAEAAGRSPGGAGGRVRRAQPTGWESKNDKHSNGGIG